MEVLVLVFLLIEWKELHRGGSEFLFVALVHLGGRGLHCKLLSGGLGLCGTHIFASIISLPDNKVINRFQCAPKI